MQIGGRITLPLFLFMANFLFSGPIPPFNNPPIEPLFFTPRQFFISAISLGITTTITTTVDQDYVIGQEIRLLIPNGFGCRGLNERTGFVIAIPSANQVTVDIFSIGIDPFINANLTTKAQIIAIGDVNTGAINNDGNLDTLTYIPGSFRNISPL